MHRLSRFTCHSFKTLRKFYDNYYEFIEETDSLEELKQIKEELKEAGYRYATERSFCSTFNGDKIFWRVYRRRDVVVPNYPAHY